MVEGVEQADGISPIGTAIVFSRKDASRLPAIGEDVGEHLGVESRETASLFE
jgi:hypothetical protein